MGRKKRRALSPEEKEEARNLKRLFQNREPKISQAEAAVQWGIGDTQGSVEQYLNGRIPLNIDVAMKFARGLPCKVRDFSPRLADDIAGITAFGIEEMRAAARPRKVGPN